MPVYTRPVIEKPVTAEFNLGTEIKVTCCCSLATAGPHLLERDSKNDIEAAHDAILICMRTGSSKAIHPGPLQELISPSNSILLCFRLRPLFTTLT
jgi:hypothetical protein